MKSKYIIDVYDYCKHNWVKVMEYSTKKVALFKYEQVKKCFPTLKYRLYEQIFLRCK